MLTRGGLPLNGCFLVARSRPGGGIRLLMPDLPPDSFPSALPAPLPGRGRTWIWDEGRWQCLLTDTLRRGPGQQAVIFSDENGREMYREEWEHHARSAGPDTTLMMAVFRPDPVSRLRLPYGGLLRDRNDSNSVLLVQAMDTVPVKALWENGRIHLRNNRFRMGEFSPPLRAPASFSTADSFLLSRNHPGFEEINAFFHLNHFRRYTDSLGFDSLATYPLSVDAHGMDGADQSAYSPLQDVLAFGDGNVDDAEDAAVVVHEYGHVLSHSALPFGNAGVERRSIEEGFCDYLAGSYARSLSDYQWSSLFKWDGHNEFWSGRTLLSSKIYPDNLVGQIHRDGEIFSAALMQIELVAGRAVTHQLLLGSLGSFVPNLKMTQAAALILETDSLLFGGQHQAIADQAFRSRGIEPGLIIVDSPEPVVRGGGSLFHLPGSQGGGWLLTGLQGGVVRITIRDAAGRSLYESAVPEGQHQVHLAVPGLAPGMYRVEVKEENTFRVFPALQMP